MLIHRRDVFSGLDSAIHFLRRFRRDQDGGLFVLLGVLAVPLILGIGMAVDGARGYLLKGRLGDAVDAAGLAATMSIEDEDHFAEDFNAMFHANFPDNYLGSKVTLADPKISDDESKVTYYASAKIDTTFMRIVGMDTLEVSSFTEVTRNSTSLDLVIAIDMSGSMDDDNRIEGAREAAKTLVNLLFGTNNANQYLQIGVVPWNAKVNVTDGTFYTSSTTEHVPGFTNPITGSFQNYVYKANNSSVPLLSEPPSNWQGCVYARYSDDYNDGNDADLSIAPLSIGGADWMGWEPIASNDEPQPNGTCANSGYGGSLCGPCLKHTIRRLTNNKEAVLSAITGLGTPQGHTNIVQGLAWALRAISPGEPLADAEEFPEGEHQRAIVILTDGEQYGNRADAYDGAFGEGSSAGGAGLDERLRTLATYAKSQGILIYSIQYYHDSGSLAALMKDVASESAAPYYQFAPDGDALDDVFKEVANHLSNLRLSQ